MTREALLNILDSGKTGSDILNLLDSLVVSEDGYSLVESEDGQYVETTLSKKEQQEYNDYIKNRV